MDFDATRTVEACRAAFRRRRAADSRSVLSCRTDRRTIESSSGEGCRSGRRFRRRRRRLRREGWRNVGPIRTNTAVADAEDGQCDAAAPSRNRSSDGAATAGGADRRDRATAGDGVDAAVGSPSDVAGDAVAAAGCCTAEGSRAAESRRRTEGCSGEGVDARLGTNRHYPPAVELPEGPYSRQNPTGRSAPATRTSSDGPATQIYKILTTDILYI